MAIKVLNKDAEFALYEYTEPSDRPVTPNALQYQEAYRNTDNGSLFYRLYEFIGENRNRNIIDFFDTKINQAREAGDQQAVDHLTALKKSYER